MFLTATPESHGLSSAAVTALVDRLEREGHDPHSLIVLRDGSELAAGWWAPYSRDRVHRLYSLCKSFTSTAVGLAVHEGRLSLDDRVLSFFPDLAPPHPSENLRVIRLPRRPRVRPVLRRASRAPLGGGDHRRVGRPAGRSRRGVGGGLGEAGR